ncbi:MAG TPA: GHKL domain-containing protein [Bacteroidales bacterium]
MILQPLFENAIKHGVYESVNTITLEIEAVMNDNYLVIKVRNNYDSEVPSRKGAGIGLKNIKERLRLTYMTEGLMNFSKTDEVFEVQILIPQQIINEPNLYEQHQGVIS